MTDSTAPTLFSPAVSPRRWLVTMADNTVRTISATACRIEHGTIIFTDSVLSLAFAPGQWRQVELATEGDR